jgi:hypothetical protein
VDSPEQVTPSVTHTQRLYTPSGLSTRHFVANAPTPSEETYREDRIGRAVDPSAHEGFRCRRYEAGLAVTFLRFGIHRYAAGCISSNHYNYSNTVTMGLGVLSPALFTATTL